MRNKRARSEIVEKPTVAEAIYGSGEKAPAPQRYIEMPEESPRQNSLVFNTTAAKHSTLALEIDIAEKLGFSGIETTSEKVLSYLTAGHSLSDLSNALSKLEIYGLGCLRNVERHGSDSASLLKEANLLFKLASDVGAKAVQIITGPLDYMEVVRFHEGKHQAGYRGVLSYTHDKKLKIAARNLKELVKVAKEFGIVLYLEALAWAPLNKLSEQRELLHRVDEDNLKLVIDYWHCFVSGDRPEDVAQVESELIYGVHVCDSLPYEGGVPNEVILRDVVTGEGVLNLQEWTDAVKATGYRGWWSQETFCAKVQQQNSYDVASVLKDQLEELLKS